MAHFGTPVAGETKAGATVGAGFEWRFAQNWTAFVEGNYYQFNHTQGGGDRYRRTQTFLFEQADNRNRQDWCELSLHHGSKSGRGEVLSFYDTCLDVQRLGSTGPGRWLLWAGG